MSSAINKSINIIFYHAICIEINLILSETLITLINKSLYFYKMIKLNDGIKESCGFQAELE